ncbi:C-type lectin domain family 2 member D-like isoform X1 [Mauremys mutica]|nr:C-type lectin domain family 2 member D-like isoform X1 [Mauremys mutica]
MHQAREFSFTLVCSDMDGMGDNFRTPRHNEEQVGDNGSNQVLTEQPRAQPPARARNRSRYAIRFMAVISIITALVVALAVVTSKRHSSPLDLPGAACPDDWVGYRGKCYLFSKADGTWNEGQSNCSSLNASLAVIDTQKDLDFLQQHKRSPECWIGLCRRDLAQPWRWVDGTEFNNSLFKVEGDGLYVYLNDRPSISLGQNAMKWICSQPDELAKRKQNGALQALLE